MFFFLRNNFKIAYRYCGKGESLFSDSNIKWLLNFCLILKGRFCRENQRWREGFSICLFIPHMAATSGVEPIQSLEPADSLWVSHSGVGPKELGPPLLLPQEISRELHHKWSSSQDTKLHSDGNLNLHATMPVPIK